MNTLDNLTLTGKVTQGTAATAANDLIRLAEAQALVASLFQAAWSAGTAYTAGQMVSRLGGLYAARTSTTGNDPATSPTQWSTLIPPAGSAYAYVAYASDSSGTGFTTTFDAALNYIAIKTSSTAISSPQASDFAGLWKNYKGASGAAGAAGSNGTNGSAGTNAYVYVRYASDSSGTGFASTPGSLTYIAILSTATAIVTPQASDFTGLWVKFVGSNGAAGSNGSNGSNGTNGTDGANAYVYVRYATDSSGTGFSSSPAGMTYMAVKSVTTVIASPQASDFAGLWFKCVAVDGAAGSNGSNGSNGTNGAAGSNAYVYIAYASDASGTGFTMTYNSAFDYIAIRSTTSPITSPGAGDFAGYWKRYKGADASGGQMRLYTTTDPNTDGVTPSDITQPGIAYKLGGGFRMFAWNTTTHLWE